MEYNFKEIEPKWQRRWQENKTYNSYYWSSTNTLNR